MARTQIKTPGIADGSVTTAKLDSSIVGALVPIGGIIMWSGTTVPSSWALCNGSNGTPDLRNKFIVAADSLTKTGITTQSGTSPYDPGDVGGSADSIVVSHTHTGTTNNAGEHSHSYTQPSIIPNGEFDNNTQVGPTFVTQTTSVAGNHNHTFTTDSAGSLATNANLPPYYALAFIMRTS